MTISFICCFHEMSVESNILMNEPPCISNVHLFLVRGDEKLYFPSSLGLTENIF